MKGAMLLLLCTLAVSSAPATVRAFSEPLLYADPAAQGGGGGRFFTGSPRDSFTCAVCHTGGETPVVTVRGFPDSYQAGKKYKVEVSWTQPREPHALTLEIVDTKGRAAGTIELPDPAEADEDARCVLAEDAAEREQVASSMFPHESRQILTVLGCGARNVSFSYTAPDDDKIALTAAVVRSDKSEDIAGDGVLELRRIAYRNGQSAPDVTAGCSLTAGDVNALGALLIITLVALLAHRRCGSW
jgi:hypothetical protein